MCYWVNCESQFIHSSEINTTELYQQRPGQQSLLAGWRDDKSEGIRIAFSISISIQVFPVCESLRWGFYLGCCPVVHWSFILQSRILCMFSVLIMDVAQFSSLLFCTSRKGFTQKSKKWILFFHPNEGYILEMGTWKINTAIYGGF